MIKVLSERLKKELFQFGEMNTSVLVDLEKKRPSKFRKTIKLQMKIFKLYYLRKTIVNPNSYIKVTKSMKYQQC